MNWTTLIVDTGAGINDNVLYFNLAAPGTPGCADARTNIFDRCLCIDQGFETETRCRTFQGMRQYGARPENGKRYVLPACIRPATGFEWGFPGSGWSNSPETTMYVRVLSIKTLLAVDPQSPASKAVDQLAQSITNWDSATRY